MATTRLYLDKALHKDGTALIRIILSNGKKVSRITTGISVMPYQWNESKSKVVNHPSADDLNIALQKKLAEAQLAMANDRASGTLSLARVRQTLDPQAGPSANIISIFDYLMQDPRKSRGTKALYDYARKKVTTFTKEKRYSTDIEDIDLNWIEAFDRWMASTAGTKRGKPMGANTRRQVFNELKKAFNEAQLRGLTKNYPFRLFRIRTVQTRKRAMPVDMLRTLFFCDCKKIMKKYQDYAKLIFFLRGINMKDLIYLRWENCINGVIEYRRAKTGRLYQIKIEPEISEILNRLHRKGSEYALPLAERYGETYERFIATFNAGVKAIMKEEYPEYPPKITSYWLRHSWASIASGLDIPKEVISEGLGHEIGSSITSIYIDFDQSKVDDANRKVMDYVLYDKK